MLEPFYYQMPPGFNSQSKLKTTILGYSRTQDLTLVYWRIESDREQIYGQSLYRDRQLLASGEGTILTNFKPEKGQAQSLKSHWNDSRRGMDETISQLETRSLQDPKNYVSLQ